jgi:hypothetical protein
LLNPTSGALAKRNLGTFFSRPIVPMTTSAAKEEEVETTTSNTSAMHDDP